MHRYTAWNFAAPTTAAPSAVTTGTSIKTMLQLATPSTRQLTVLSWGFTLDQPPSSTNTGTVELLQTDVAATVTAHAASGLVQLDPNAPDSLLTLGTGATGYTATAEGSITATRPFDLVEVPGLTAGADGGGIGGLTYEYQFMPDERPIVAVSRFLRVRVTFAAAVNMTCYVTWDE
ncbi:hypothetical protein [Streptomyces boncukensis]|uniref:Uncharacterized protein n=1 Tax=Streptomyces boncukensis TaxID=2711219 RepID=A0A6G4X8V7_9ACTN|nr:hypothetical protein [Streptomyces boncukensis]NGO73290.1 hypothetical protein [Streptomyces boncukensis]